VRKPSSDRVRSISSERRKGGATTSQKTKKRGVKKGGKLAEKVRSEGREGRGLGRETATAAARGWENSKAKSNVPGPGRKYPDQSRGDEGREVKQGIEPGEKKQ